MSLSVKAAFQSPLPINRTPPRDYKSVSISADKHRKTRDPNRDYRTATHLSTISTQRPSMSSPSFPDPTPMPSHMPGSPSPSSSPNGTLTLDVATAFEDLLEDNCRLTNRVLEFERELGTHRLRQHVGDHFLCRLVQSITEPLECPRCHSLMWEPYQMQCGHSVCAHCSHAWFDRINNTFLVRHPGVDLRSPVVLPQLLFDLASRKQAELWEVSVLFQHLVHPPHAKRPRYTCPTCECELHSASTENLGLKAAVQAWATSRGFRPPPPAPSQTVLRLRMESVTGMGRVGTNQVLEEEGISVERSWELAMIDLEFARWHMAQLRKRLAMQVAFSQALARRRRNAACQAGLAQDALFQTKKLLEQALISLEMQQDINRILRMQLEVLETRCVDSVDDDVECSAL
ncbi:hypothetical protein EV421DRAFT_1902183 [Armillaria borealis]|uniref:RING-type domain-containing protein n=1 Tax=Armillaria borealis TaxID=47425 RepID=A0AA39MTA6_9AGAR|nr:hypothetical protein EV421DRAFT_1902183 [Armillaria borealis]